MFQQQNSGWLMVRPELLWILLEHGNGAHVNSHRAGADSSRIMGQGMVGTQQFLSCVCCLATAPACPGFPPTEMLNCFQRAQNPLLAGPSSGCSLLCLIPSLGHPWHPLSCSKAWMSLPTLGCSLQVPCRLTVGDEQGVLWHGLGGWCLCVG